MKNLKITLIERMRMFEFVLIILAYLIILTTNITVYGTSLEEIFDSLVDNTSSYINPQYSQDYSNPMASEHNITNPYNRQEESFCSDTSIMELMKIPTSDLFNPETMNAHNDYNPRMHNQTVYNVDAFNSPTQMAPSQHTSNSPLHGIGSSYMEEVPTSSHTNRKRKIIGPIEDIFPNRLITIMPPIVCVARDSDEYKKFLEGLHKHRLSVKDNNENNRQIAPLFYNQVVDNNAIKSVNKDLITRIESTTNASNNLWMGLQSIKEESIKTKLAIIEGLLHGSYNLKSTFALCKVLYYPRILYNLSNYLYRNIISSYNARIIKDLLHIKNRINLDEFNLYKATLGDIYIKNNMNLLWHAESVLMYYTNLHINCSTYLFADGIELKRQLLFILCIPEIYEDLFYMKYEEINMLKDLIIKNTFNGTSRPTYNMFCIIEYLHGVVHKNSVIMDESFKKIQEIEDIGLYLQDLNCVTIYHFVYNVFAYFYKYSLYLYEIDTNALISSTDPLLQNDCNYMAKKKYTKIPEDKIIQYRGKGSVIATNYIKCIIEFEYVADSMVINERILDIIKTKGTKYGYNSINNIGISYCYHYHVQFVDNSAHRMHIMHIPFFVSNDPGILKYNYMHTLKDIVDHIKRIFHIVENKKNIFINNVHPFKYNRAEKTWSLVTKPNNTKAKRRKLEVTENEMNKTMEEMHNSGFDVVFYYIKENIKTTEFVFAQFNPIDGMVINKAYEEDPTLTNKLFDGCMINRTAPRIPLFLPKLMTSAIHLGPYVLKSEMYQSKSLDECQNLVPVEFSNWLDHLANKNTSNQKKIIEVVKEYKRCINYYSDFVILSINQPYEDCDCYGICIGQLAFNNTCIVIEWYAKRNFCIEEYTNYHLLITPSITNNFINNIKRNNSCQELLLSFLNIFQRKHVSQDMLYYGICVYTERKTSKSYIIPILCPKMKTRLQELLNENNEMHHMLSSELKKKIARLKKYINENIRDIHNVSRIHITVKSVNYTKSKLGLHYNILNIFF